jgi:putative holliday junction resolvase
MAPSDAPEAIGAAVGVDLGEARIGVAATDSRRTVATPREVIRRSGEERADHLALAAVVEELGATLVVVGLPLSLDGRRGPAARRIGEEAERLRGVLSVPVVLADERFSTVEATRRRREHRAARGAPVDAMAAALILQTFVDSQPR